MSRGGSSGIIWGITAWNISPRSSSAQLSERQRARGQHKTRLQKESVRNSRCTCYYYRTLLCAFYLLVPFHSQGLMLQSVSRAFPSRRWVSRYREVKPLARASKWQIRDRNAGKCDYATPSPTSSPVNWWRQGVASNTTSVKAANGWVQSAKHDKEAHAISFNPRSTLGSRQRYYLSLTDKETEEDRGTSDMKGLPDHLGQCFINTSLQPTPKNPLF